MKYETRSASEMKSETEFQSETKTELQSEQETFGTLFRTLSTLNSKQTADNQLKKPAKIQT